VYSKYKNCKDNCEEEKHKKVSLCIQSTKIAEKIRQTKTKVDLSVFKLQELQKSIEKKKKRNTRTTKTNWEKMERG